jgi:FKBP-type peptidyl-prolyl cis-trans isomerase 2
MDLYRYIETDYDEGRDSKAEIVRGTTFEIIYTAYIFSGSAPTTANMYATNDAENIQKLQNEGLNTEYEWTSEPMKIKLGSDKLTSGLETALEGCREGDVVEIYMTYAEAYGNKYIGKVPSKSSVVWFIKITNVE